MQVHPMRRWRKIALGIVAAALLAGGSVLALTARSHALTLITNPAESRRLPGDTPASFGLRYEDVGVVTADGLSLVGWYVPASSGAAIIAQHGYKADRGEMLNEAAMLQRHGYGVLITTTRAHDLSDGTLITFGHHELKDLVAWLELLRRRPDVDASRIGYLGNSLGGTLGLKLAAERADIAAVAANSAFSSLEDTIETSVRFFTGLPPFPFAPLITFWAERAAGFRAAEIDAKAWIARISPRPVLLMQGGADVVITRTSGERLFQAAGEPKELWVEPKVGHSAFDRVMPEEYERRVVGFFDKYLRANRPVASGAGDP
jgi:fermentation-respiration switch protein FrsA (DUF1100 family)